MKKQYGKEIREKYGEEAVKKSNQQFMNMTEEEYNELKELEKKVFETLKEAYKTGNPAGELGQKTAELHKEWIWSKYRKWKDCLYKR